MTAADIITALFLVVTLSILAYIVCKGEYNESKRLLDYKLEHNEFTPEEYNNQLSASKTAFYISLVAVPLVVVAFFFSIALAAIFITLIFSGYYYHRHHRL